MGNKPKLDKTHPEVASRLLDPDPTTVVAGSGKNGTWKCPNHEEPFIMRINRYAAGAQCPYCSRRQVLPGFNDLATTHPDIADTMVDDDPTQVLSGSDRKVLWRCPNHDAPYPMSVTERVHGTGCGYCANTSVLPGFNDLATTHPELARDVVDTVPTTVMAGSNTVVQWRCPNHEQPYTAMVRERVKGHGCGYCAGKRILIGFNDLASQYPGLASELLDVDPTTVSVTSGRKVSWRCPNHDEPYTAKINDRVEGTGCHYCSGLRILPGFNDIASQRCDLAPLLLSPDPTTVTAGSQRTGTWRCTEHDGTYDMRISHRTTTSGCPYCSGKRILPGFNDLATTHPALAAELLEVDPTTVTSGMSGLFTWSCPNHPEPYTARMGHRARGNGCPYCSHRQVLAGFNDLASQHAHLAVELVGEDPAAVIAGGADKHLWRCENHPNHPFPATVRARVEDRACPVCSGRLLMVGVNDLASQRPDLVEQLLSPNASEVTTASTTRGTWLCPNHSEPYTARIRDRVEGRGCPYCARRRVLVGFNDLATTRPDLAAELLNVNPTTISAGSKTKVTWRCENHDEPYTAAVVDRAGGTGCPYCSNRRLLVGYNDLASVRPDLASEMLSPDPTTVMRASRAKARWRCHECGTEWTKSVYSRTYDKSGCPDCNLGGYRVTKAGYLYLMARQGEQQVGITNDPATRLARHALSGWELVDMTEAMNGQRVADIELQIRRWLRAQAWTLDRTHENWSTANLEVGTLGELFTAAGVIDPVTGQPMQ